MFEYIRTHQRLMQILLFIIMLPFILTFRNFSFDDNDKTIAKVGGKSISQIDLDNALRGMGPNAAASPEARKSAFDQLVGEAALDVEAHKDHAFPTQSEVGNALLAYEPSLAKLNKEQRDAMLTLIARNNGLSIAGLEAQMRDRLVVRHYLGTIGTTAYVPTSVSARLVNYYNQSREVQQLLFKTSDYTSQVKVTDDMLKSYYNKNLAQFQSPEQSRIEYVVLSEDVLAQQIAIADDAAEKYYKDNIAQFTSEPQWRLSHILVSVKPNANAAEKAAAKEKADKIAAEVRKTPANFAKLAKEDSEDPGSADNGGDLGYFSNAPSKAKEGFEPIIAAMQKMKTGDISDPILTGFGYSVVLVTDAKPIEVKPFEATKADVVATLKKKQAHSQLTDLHDIFDHTVFEQSDSLKPVVDKLADKVKLTVQTATITRKPDPDTAPIVPYNSPKFLTAMFTDDVLKNKHNSDAVEVRDGVLISGRVVQYQPAAQKTFEQVKADVNDAVVKAEAKVLAQKAAEAKIAALNTKDDSAGFEEAKTVSRVSSAGFESTVWKALTKASATPDKLPAFVQIEVPGQGYGVFRINKIIVPPTVDPAIKDQFNQMAGEAEAGVYVEALKDKANVKIVRQSAIDTPPPAQSGPAGSTN